MVTLALLDGLIKFLTESTWTYFILFALCLGDAVLPVLPSEAAAIVCGIEAAQGHLSLGWVLTAAALGAFLGDNTSYALGRWLGRPIQGRSSAARRRSGGSTGRRGSSTTAAVTSW